MQQSEALWKVRRVGPMCRRSCQSSHSKRPIESSAAIDGLERGAVLYCIVYPPLVAIPVGTDLGG